MQGGKAAAATVSFLDSSAAPYVPLSLEDLKTAMIWCCRGASTRVLSIHTRRRHVHGMPAGSAFDLTFMQVLLR